MVTQRVQKQQARRVAKELGITYQQALVKLITGHQRGPGTPPAKVTLIFGGTASGKSSHLKTIYARSSLTCALYHSDSRQPEYANLPTGERTHPEGLQEIYIDELTPLNREALVFSPGKHYFVAVHAKTIEQALSQLRQHTLSEYDVVSIHETIYADGERYLRIRRVQNANPAKVLAIHSARGGTGKTRTVAEAAEILSKQGYSTLVVDTDTKDGNLHLYTGLQSEAVTPNGDQVHYTKHGYEVLRCHSIKQYAHADDVLKFVSEFVEKVKANYDFILIDVPAQAADSITEYVFGVADTIIVLTNSTTSSYKEWDCLTGGRYASKAVAFPARLNNMRDANDPKGTTLKKLLNSLTRKL